MHLVLSPGQMYAPITPRPFGLYLFSSITLITRVGYDLKSGNTYERWDVLALGEYRLTASAMLDKVYVIRDYEITFSDLTGPYQSLALIK